MDEYNQRAKQWDEKMYSIGRKELSVFEGNNVGYTENLIEANCRRHLMRWIYHQLVNKGKIKRLEDCTVEQKNDLWGFVKEVCAGKTEDPVKMKEMCMVFYTLEYFLNEKD